MTRFAIVFAASLMLAACSARNTEVALIAPPPPPPAPPPTPAPPPDTCGALEHQHLIGRPRTEIPVPVRPDSRRVMCTTCPATMDYREDRLNFLFNAASGRIEKITCG